MGTGQVMACLQGQILTLCYSLTVGTAVGQARITACNVVLSYQSGTRSSRNITLRRGHVRGFPVNTPVLNTMLARGHVRPHNVGLSKCYVIRDVMYFSSVNNSVCIIVLSVLVLASAVVDAVPILNAEKHYYGGP